jgi:hypothetical protein
MARNHAKPTTGAAATYIQVGEYVAANVDGGIDSYDLRQREDRAELRRIAARLDGQRQAATDGGEA